MISNEPTEDEIKAHRKVLAVVERSAGFLPRDYTDAEVVASLTKTCPDGGGSTLGELRAFGIILDSVYR